MSIFSTILQKLGIEKPAQPAQVTPTKPLDKPLSPTPYEPISSPVPPSAPSGTTSAQTQDRFISSSEPLPPSKVSSSIPPSAAAGLGAAPVMPTPAPMEMVDVMGKLSAMAHKNPQQLDWKVSIVDLLKLLGIDSSYNARKELAIELGCPANFMDDSAQMNVWLHKTVLQKIAENGGNIPKELLD
jgi:hypothetical protein